MLHTFRNALGTLCVLLLVIVLPSHGQGILRITTGTFYPAHGKAILLVYDSTVSSLDSKNSSKAIRRYVAPVTGPQCTFTIDSLKNGRYAVEVFHDENENGTHEFVLEDFGFTGPESGVGAPKFKTAAFCFDGVDRQIFIPLENEFARNQVVYKSKVAFNPVFGYAPETNVLLGANMFKLFRHRDNDTLARTSYVDALAVGTFHKQIILEQNYLIFTRDEHWMISGVTGFSKFPQSYFGIGNNDTRAKETVNYSQFRFEHLLMRKIQKKLFAGIGYRYTNLFHMRYGDNSRFVTTPTAGAEGAITSGVQLAVSWDNRNNVYNTSTGHLIRIKTTLNSKSLASGFSYNTYELDFRQFFKPIAFRHDVLAIQVYGFSATGNVPWSEMGALGSDMIMRGYYSGRYRDKSYAAGQVEYRRSFNKMFGGVVFAGLGEVSDKISNLSAHYIKPNYGFGGRMTVDRKERLNLRLDFGWGKHSSNVYFTLAEAF